VDRDRQGCDDYTISLGASITVRDAKGGETGEKSSFSPVSLLHWLKAGFLPIFVRILAIPLLLAIPRGSIIRQIPLASF
jgi:hypothetical protein